MTGIWAVLGVPADSDRDTIRRAYAKKLRVTNPEDDPEGFKRLREAYDSALVRADYVARWGGDDDDYDAEEEEERGFSPGKLAAMADPLARPDPPVLWHDSPDAPEPGEEARALLAGRDDDLAVLRQVMAALESALRGAWRPPDDEIEVLFADIMRAAAMGEIAVRGDVERWVAELIADAIPRSDAILAQAVAAFCWSGTGTHRGGYHVHVALERLDEWRLIAALGQPGHTLNPAWDSLIKPPVRQPWWRLKALSPGLVRGVRSLLGDFGYVSPGLHFSFNAASVERWRSFLARPRLTLGALLLAVAGWSGSNATLATIPALHDRVPYWAGALILLLSLATPFAVTALRATVNRHRTLVARGWVAAFAALGIAAILMPADPISAIAVTLGTLVVLGWIVVAADAEHPTPSWRAAGRWLSGSAIYLLLGVPIAMRLVPSAMLVLLDMVVLATVVRTTMTEQLRADFARIAPVRPGLAGAFILAALIVAGSAATAARLALYHGDGAVFIGGTLTLLLVLPALAVLGTTYGRWVLVAHIALAVAFVFAIAGPLLPNTPGNPDLRPSTEVSQADVLDDIKRQRPNIEQLQTGNPEAWAAISSAAEQRSRGEIDDHAMSTRINDAIDAAYRERLPNAPALLVAEERRIKLAEWLEVRKLSVAACARNDMSALKVWPASLRLRLQTHIYAVAAWPMATAKPETSGKVIPAIDLAKGAARIIDRPVADLIGLLKSEAQTAAVCDARIAMLQALVGYPDADIAATVRAAPAKKTAPAR